MASIADKFDIIGENSSNKRIPPDQGFVLTDDTTSINCSLPPVNDSTMIRDDFAKNSTGEKTENENDDDNENFNNNINDEQTEEFVYIEPEQNPYVTSVNYLEEHHIMQIFQHLTSGIVYEKPEEPLQYMVDELGRMKAKKLEGVRFPGS